MVTILDPAIDRCNPIVAQIRANRRERGIRTVDLVIWKPDGGDTTAAANREWGFRIYQSDRGCAMYLRHLKECYWTFASVIAFISLFPLPDPL